MQTTNLIALLQNLLPVCPAPYEADVRSTIEPLKGFEIIFTEGLDDADDHVALLDSIEDAHDLLDQMTPGELAWARFHAAAPARLIA